MLQHPYVLLLSSDDNETAVLQQVLREQVILTVASTLSEAMFLLEDGRYDALFCAWSYDRGTWYEAVERVRSRYPDLPVIILSRVAQEKEWLAVLEAGAFDLLVPPYEERELLAVLEQASASQEARISRGVPGHAAE